MTFFHVKHPFDKEFDTGYIINSQGRNSIVLYRYGNSYRKTISYARYLMSVHLGRHLTQDETVDHINNIKDDDRIANLQVMSRCDNIKKEISRRGKTFIEYECSICGKLFSIEVRRSHYGSRRLSKAVTCGRVCGGKATHETPSIPIREIRRYTFHKINYRS